MQKIHKVHFFLDGEWCILCTWAIIMIIHSSILWKFCTHLYIMYDETLGLVIRIVNHNIVDIESTRVQYFYGRWKWYSLFYYILLLYYETKFMHILWQAELFRGLEAALGSTFGSDPLAPPPNPLIIVISGPSGVGKDAVIKVLC